MGPLPPPTSSAADAAAGLASRVRTRSKGPLPTLASFAAAGAAADLASRVRARPEGPLPTPASSAAAGAAAGAAADPASSPLSGLGSLTPPPPTDEKVPPGPANPGVVRSRHEGVLARLPRDCDILDEVARLSSDENLSDEQVILKLMMTYDVTLATLNRVSGNVYPTLLYRNLSAVFSHTLLTLSTNHSRKITRIVQQRKIPGNCSIRLA
jgi:hypothetical protein